MYREVKIIIAEKVNPIFATSSIHGRAEKVMIYPVWVPFRKIGKEKEAIFSAAAHD